MDAEARDIPMENTAILAGITIMSCCLTLVTATITLGWVECEFYFRPSQPAFGKDPGPFGWERVKRDFPWNPKQAPWATADIIAILGIYGASSAFNRRPKWWPICAMSILFAIYTLGGIETRMKLSTAPMNLILDFASLLNVLFAAVTALVARGVQRNNDECSAAKGAC